MSQKRLGEIEPAVLDDLQGRVVEVAWGLFDNNSSSGTLSPIRRKRVCLSKNAHAFAEIFHKFVTKRNLIPTRI